MLTFDAEDRDALRDAVTSVLDRRSGSAAVRKLVDDEPPCVDTALSKEMAELGWTGLLIPESLGGSEAGMAAVVVVLEGLGSHTAPGPYLSSAVLVPTLLMAAGGDTGDRWLPLLATDDAVGAVAVTGAGGRVDTGRFDVRASRTAQGRAVNGTARFVLDGASADLVVVGASDPESAAPMLLVVPTDADGVAIESVASIDRTRSLADITFSDVEVPSESVFAAGDAAVAAIDRLVDVAAVALAADGLGAAQRSLDMAVEYAKQREQFGRVIGSFQAIKHKLADMFVLTEGARAAVEGAAEALDRDPSEARRRAATAGSFCRAAASRVTGDSVQAHGGIGFTWEHDCHLLLKRAKFDEIYLTDLWSQRERLIETIMPRSDASLV